MEREGALQRREILSDAQFDSVHSSKLQRLGLPTGKHLLLKNAILLVDYTNFLRRRDGMELMEAIKETGRKEFAPF